MGDEGRGNLLGEGEMGLEGTMAAGGGEINSGIERRGRETVSRKEEVKRKKTGVN